MSDVLITGASGTLGRLVARQLRASSHPVRLLVRRAPTAPPGFSHAIGDLRDGATLLAALEGVGTVVHCASDPHDAREVDLFGTARLLEAMRATGAKHLIYVSIVGVDRIPLRYYGAKRDAERLVERSGLGWTIQRATQFHQLVDALMATLSRYPLMPIPRHLSFQPLAPTDLAQRLVRHVTDGPAGRPADFGGPDVHTASHLASSWLEAHDRRRPQLPTPLPGRVGRAMKEGANLCPDQAEGNQTWHQYLAEKQPAVQNRSRPTS